MTIVSSLSLRTRNPTTCSFHSIIVHCVILGFYFAWLWPAYLRPKALDDPARRRTLVDAGNYTCLSGEWEIVSAVGLSLLLKLRRFRTTDEVLRRAVFFHLKILTVVLTYVGGDGAALGALLTVYAVITAFLPPSRYSGKSLVTPLNPFNFVAEVLRKAGDYNLNPAAGSTSSTDDVVFFHVPWSQDCHYFEPILADLSVEHSTEERKFWSVNLDMYLDLGTDLGIDTSTRSRQIPALILFHRGKEVRRLPPLNDRGQATRTHLDRKGVAKYFGFDKAPGSNSTANQKGAEKKLKKQ